MTATFLKKLFAAVIEQYVTCDGRVINGGPSSAQGVTELRLINADTDQPLMTLSGGTTIVLADLPTRNLNIQALTNPNVVGSVRFALDGNPNYRTETTAPYALAGDTSGDYLAWTSAPGTHTLTATPYSGAGATGNAGTPLTVTFTVR